MKYLNIDKRGYIRSRIEILGLRRDIKSGKIIATLWGGEEKKMDFSEVDVLIERGVYDENRI